METKKVRRERKKVRRYRKKGELRQKRKARARLRETWLGPSWTIVTMFSVVIKIGVQQVRKMTVQ